MILSTLDKSRKGGAYEQIPSLVLGQRWTPQLNSRNMMKVVLCVWIEPYIENDLSFCVWPVHTPTTSKEVLTLSASTSPLPYTGNKSCIVNTILSVMPKHTVYIDPCMGSAEVFFRKPRAEKEILNDYYPSDWNTADKARNEDMADELNGKLGVTSAQRQAMEVGSMAGWNVPGANPAAYEQDVPQQGGMTLA